MRDRREVVAHLAMLLETELKSRLDLLEAIFTYLPANPLGISPYMAVVPGGTAPGTRRSREYFANVYWFVLYVDQARDIDEADSWDAIEAIHDAFFDLLDTLGQSEGWWTNIQQTEATLIDTIEMENHGYLLEVCPLMISVH